MSNTIGRRFKVTTFGESHGPGIGVVIDGCPSHMKLDKEAIKRDLERRRPGQSRLTTRREETEDFQILSGVFEGYTTGSPLTIWIPNQDAKSKDYEHIKECFRPSHADFTYEQKYGIRDYRGGGRSSARETAARVAAGAVAKQILAKHGIEIYAWVSQVGSIKLEKNYMEIDFSIIEQNAVRCPDKEVAMKMEEEILRVKKLGDTIGGIVSCVLLNVPAGIGDPMFEKLSANLAKGMFSIPAVKGFEYGSGFAGVEMLGSQHNDIFYVAEDGKVKTKTNNSGGIQGGISNGMPINFRVAFKPVATILQKQMTINRRGEEVIIEGRGRHDPCVVPRAVPIVEAMAAIILADNLVLSKKL